MNLPREKAWHFEEEYGSLDYTDAVVLDIGADYGSTAEFFLERGARLIFAVEKNPEWRQRLWTWAGDKPVIVANGWLTEETADVLMEWAHPDIVKCDCEGAEVHLLGVSDNRLSLPRAWVVETHTDELFRRFQERFEGLGYTFTVIKDYGPEPNRSGKVCRVWTAMRGGPSGKVYRVAVGRAE